MDVSMYAVTIEEDDHSIKRIRFGNLVRNDMTDILVSYIRPQHSVSSVCRHPTVTVESRDGTWCW